MICGGGGALTIHRIFDHRVCKGDRVDGVIIATTDAADGESMTSRAGAATESDVLCNV